MNNNIFDNELELPNAGLKKRADQLIGFEEKYQRVFGNLKMLLDPSGIEAWSKKFYKTELPVIHSLSDRYPLIILAGDVGTGKTVSAEAVADRVIRELGKEGFFLKLSTRVRGEGLHGQMGNLVNDAFEKLKNQAGKRRIAFLLIDEADAIATSRSTMQMHQEEKAAVNTLIQKIDEIRELKGRAVLFMSTNRVHFLDEAIVRRAAIVMQFSRPNKDERREFFERSLAGIDFSENEFAKLSELTGAKSNDGLGYSYSDLALKILPEAIARSFPDNKLSFETLRETIKRIKPSPEIK